MRITKTFVEKISLPEKIKEGRTEQKRYYDDNLKGFGLRVTSGGSKAFFVEKLVNNRLQRITVGRFPEISTEVARKEAQILLGKIATGVNPVAEKKAKRIKRITLQEVFNDYLKARKSLKPLTVTDYERVLKQVVPDWLDKPLTIISRDMIAKRHMQYGESNSKARSNLAMRVLRALFNFAINQYQASDGKEIFTENPIKRLSHTRAWYRINRKQTVIKSNKLADWYQGLIRLSEWHSKHDTEMWQDYFLLVLFTGLRRQEAASLRWDNVDLDAKTFTLHDTKNRNSHTLPMSEFLLELFERRKKSRQNEYVFSAKSDAGHLIEPRKAMLKVAELSGVGFTVHDLRRTFVTIAESLEIPAYALKRLLNHNMNHDVTAGYIIMDVERLRKPMQQISDYMLRCMGTKQSGEVVMLKRDNEQRIEEQAV